jgi:phenylalanyl-tRNA synthetase beta chain
VSVAWLREFADVPNDVGEVAARLAACGFEVAEIDGDVVDFEITANRPDCLSVYGLAREASVAFGATLGPPPGGPDGEVSASGPIPVSIDDPGCGRYALATADVTVGPSPAWLALRLEAGGVRPINNVVDVTNYVMLEMGHPMHAFDADALAGPRIRVRPARAGETLKTLDGQDRTLDHAMLAIADGERTVALAGVIGGADSEVSGTTTRIALESAWFQPAAVRATSRLLVLKTEASARFERGADIAAPPRAIRRAMELLERISAGRATGAILDVYPQPAEPRTVDLQRSRLARLLGDAVPDEAIERILEGLGFALGATDGGWRVGVPSFRVDVTREADLIEEVGRHWGFDRLPVTVPALRSIPREPHPRIGQSRRLRRVLSGAGLQEAWTFTFIEQAAAAPFTESSDALVTITNPLSEKFSTLRPSLLPGLLDALTYNRRRGRADIEFYEVGATFSPSGERSCVGWLMTGDRVRHWSGPERHADFYDSMGVADLVADVAGFEYDVERADDVSWFVPGRAARLIVRGSTPPVTAGIVGQIQPRLAAARGFDQPEPIFGGEVDLTTWFARGPRYLAAAAARIESIPTHPSVVRDLSILVDERLPAAELRGTIRANAPDTLVGVREFDRYLGKGVPADHVSLSIRLTFRAPERTLTDTEVQQALDTVVAALRDRHGARLRQ